MTDKRWQALSFFISQGWTPQQSAGLVANLEAESALRPDAVGDGGQAYGIAQWHPPRQANFSAVIGKDIRGSSFEEQLHFVHAELQQTERAAGDTLRSCNTAAEAGACVSKLYERPADREGEAAKRARLAESIYREYAPEQPAAPIEEGGATLQPAAPADKPQGAGMGIGMILGLLTPVLQAMTGTTQAQVAPILTQAAALTGAAPPAPGSKDELIVRFATDMMGMVLKAGGAPPNATEAQKVQATAAVLADPTKLKSVEDDALARLNALGPTFDRLAAADKAANEAALAGKDSSLS